MGETRDPFKYDSRVYAGLCALNIVLLSVTCWLTTTIGKKPTYGLLIPFVLVIIGAILDLFIMYGCNNKSYTLGWHCFMAVAFLLWTVGTSVTLSIGIDCEDKMNDPPKYDYCGELIGLCVLGGVIMIVEAFIVKIAHNAGFYDLCCGLDDSTVFVESVPPPAPEQNAVVNINNNINVDGIQNVDQSRRTYLDASANYLNNPSFTRNVNPVPAPALPSNGTTNPYSINDDNQQTNSCPYPQQDTPPTYNEAAK